MLSRGTAQRLPEASRIAAVISFLFACYALFYNLGGRFLSDWDEAWHVMMIEAAMRTGNYLFLEFMGDIFWDKSPFAFFPMVPFFKLLGVNEASARLSSALFGLGLFVQIYFLANRFYGRWTAALAVLVAATIPQFLFNHGLRTANIDSITMFFLFGSVFCWLMIKQPSRRIALTSASIAFTFLCKGPIIAIPLIAIAVSLLFDNPFRKNGWRLLFIALATAAVIVLPWYLTMYARFGDRFITEHILKNYIQRYGGSLYNHPGDDRFFIRLLLSTDMFPWWGVAAGALIYALKRFSEDRMLVDALLVVLVTVTFLIVNQSQTKLIWYIFPLYPPLAILTARTLAAFIERPDYLNRTAVHLGLAVPLTHFFVTWGSPDPNSPNLDRALMISLFLFGLCSAAERVNSRAGRAGHIFVVCLLCSLPIQLVIDNALHRDTESPVSSLVSYLDPRKTVFTLGLYPAAYYYLSKVGSSWQEVSTISGGTTFVDELLLMRTEAFDKAVAAMKEKGAGPGADFRIAVEDSSYRITPTYRGKELTVLSIRNEAKP